MVICPAKAMSRKIRPVMAGLAKLQPMPPNSCLTITIATKQPTMAIQMGNPAGRFIASSRPVTAALKSEMVLVRLVILRNRYSNRIDTSTQMISSTRARVPNTRTEATTAGSSAMRTSRMTEVVEAPPRT